MAHKWGSIPKGEASPHLTNRLEGTTPCSGSPSTSGSGSCAGMGRREEALGRGVVLTLPGKCGLGQGMSQAQEGMC